MALRGYLTLALLLIGVGWRTEALAQKIVAFGDSITDGDGDNDGKGGYPGRLESLLLLAGMNVQVVNEGVGGENVLEGLSRLSTIKGSAADTLILMEGTNDVPSNTSLESIADTLGAMVAKGFQRGFGRVLLSTIIPRGPGTNAKNGRVETQQLAWEIREEAYRRQVGQPEAFEVLFDTPQLHELYYSDPLHPNGKGYDILAGIFADYILGDDTVPPAPSFVVPANQSESVSPSSRLEVVFYDAQSGVDSVLTDLTLNGVPLGAQSTGVAGKQILTYQPGGLGGSLQLGVISRDLEGNEKVKPVSDFTVKGASLLAGDLDFSCRVDGVDLVVFARAFGASTGGERYVLGADIDRNGTIDGTDLARLAANFGLSIE